MFIPSISFYQLEVEKQSDLLYRNYMLSNSEERYKSLSDSNIRNLIFKIVSRRVPNFADAEDITQNVLYRAWKRIEEGHEKLDFDNEEQFIRYIKVISVNETRRFQSRIMQSREIYDEELFETLEADEINPELCFTLLGLLSEIPLRQQLILLLKEQNLLLAFRKVFSSELIAETIGIDQTTLKQLEMEIPVKDDDRLKEIVARITGKTTKTPIRTERWAVRNFFKKIGW